MALWRQVRGAWRIFFGRGAADRDLAEEIQHYFENAAEEHAARGLSREEAFRAAQLEGGRLTQVAETVRDARWEMSVESFASDVRYAFRRLTSSPGFAITTVTILALAIGATTAIAGALRPILFEPLPYPQPDRLALIVESQDGVRNDGTFGMYRALTEGSRTLSSLAVFKPWAPVLMGTDNAERLRGQRVSVEYFTTLGVAPRMGRAFSADEDRPGGGSVVVLSDAIWKRRFGADPSVIGSMITLDGTSASVIGVMPGSFENVLDPAAELWSPLQYDMSQGRAWGHHLLTVARLQQGVSFAQTSSELTDLGNRLLRDVGPETYGSEVSVVAAPLREEVTASARPASQAILVGVALMLLLSCINVTSLLLARGVARRSEFALRAALGARRQRLVRQLLTETSILAAMGGVAGLLVAMAGLELFVRLSPPDLPRLGAVVFDPSAFFLALVITILTGLGIGIAPALSASRADPQQAFQAGSRRLTGGQQRFRRFLVAAEVGITVVLLIASGLLARSVDRLLNVEGGFDARGVLTMQIHAANPRFRSDTISDRLFNDVLDAVKRTPGVTAAAFTSQLPLSGDRDEYGVRFEGDRQGYSSARYAVSSGYIETLRIPLLQGRTMGDRDGAASPRVALVSEQLARQRFPNGDALGKRLSIGPVDSITIVGVVGNVRQLSLAEPASDAVYVPLDQWPFAEASLSMVIRGGSENIMGLTSTLRDAIWAVDPDQAISRVTMMEDLMAADAAERRFALQVFGLFGLGALLLAGAGIFGVISGSISERTREIGLRSALGATRGAIVGMVLQQGLVLAAFGILAGLTAAVPASGSLSALLFGVKRLDPVTYTAVVLLVALVALLACWIPAYRASRLDPAQTLRAE